MPDKYRVKLVPTTAHLKPDGNGNFTSAAKAGAGTFPVETELTVSLEQNGGGTPPLTVGQKQPARLEFLARVKDPKDPAAAYTTVGTLVGEITLKSDPSHSPPAFPFFTCRDPGKPPPNSTTIDPSTAATVAPSDWNLPVTLDADTFLTLLGRPSIVLPWQFGDPKTASSVFQVNARLTIAGTVETDVTGATANTPAEVHLKHQSVADDAVPNKPADHPVSTFYGVRALYTMSAFQLGTIPKLPVGTNTVNIVLDRSVTDFLRNNSKTTDAAVAGVVAQVFRAAGFAAVNVDATAAGQTRCRANYKEVRPTSGTGTWFMSVNVPKARSTAVADSLEADAGGGFLDTDVVTLPFFDWFVVVQSTDPPPGVNELAHSEGLPGVLGSNNGVFVKSTTKASGTPIVLTGGASSSTGIRGALAGVNAADHVNFVAQIICHEVGHGLGLRHPVRFDPAAPFYSAADVADRGVMGPGPTAKFGQIPAEIRFFGPVHTEAIRQRFL